MNNLGAYQWITTMSKKVGGPVNLLLLVGGGSIVLWKTGENICKKIVNYINKNMMIDQNVYEVINDFKYCELSLLKGDKIKIVAVNKIVAFVEIVNGQNNPYVVSTEYLKKNTTFGYEN